MERLARRHDQLLIAFQTGAVGGGDPLPRETTSRCRAFVSHEKSLHSDLVAG
ncbi:hypothetical protein ACFYOD_36525 [Streptomyces sp. NPDC006703]|uniref:hypothetical protein n=1 Tax=Streptomyces sp. NPDC006703 TaxID=3364759 RepID=UPI0036932A6E